MYIINNNNIYIRKYDLGMALIFKNLRFFFFFFDMSTLKEGWKEIQTGDIYISHVITLKEGWKEIQTGDIHISHVIPAD
jgi:hypothetical protein